ncbi:MAG TPA: GNAT family N-acetyltransferase [Candidatus Paceibacterota bacterium]|nr:GNAT family N-acetyltransferase [Candidatus Paceibacterota bacterium]
MGLLITPSESEKTTLPSQLYESTVLATAIADDGSAFTIVAGLTEAIAADLKRHSLDESDVELMKSTSDKRRFGEGSFETWFKKERYAFALVDGDALAALIWFGPEEMPHEFQSEHYVLGTHDTLGFRSYEPYRGKRLMTDFSRFVIDAYARMRPGRTLWLQTNTDNGAAIRLYQKLGFIEKGVGTDNGRLVMVQP